jgi:UDP-GlcNAc:undecaprenyl-phosphate/decaprenyl-phosphate GlcNAc-1-phosphate transferase
MGLKYAVFFVISAFVSFCFVVFLSVLSPRFKFLRNSHGVPLTGGLAIAIVFGFFSYCLSFSDQSLLSLFKALLPATCLIFLAEVWDDYKELSVGGKVVTQILATTLLVVSGIRTHIVFLNDTANIIVTFIWVLAITNAFNLLDIMDGLCAAAGIIVSFGLFLICVFNRDIQASGILVILIGSLFGFFILNAPPAKIYMGNAGSHFLGFVLAVLSISISYASQYRQIALVSPIMVMGFPIFDTLFVVMMRISNGKSAVKKSRDHLVLRFLELGHSKPLALIFMCCQALFFTVCGILVSQLPNRSGLGVIVFVVAVGIALAVTMSRVAIDG